MLKSKLRWYDAKLIGPVDCTCLGKFKYELHARNDKNVARKLSMS